jgi:hypothetical protein
MSIGKTLKSFMLPYRIDITKEPFAVEWLKDNEARNAFDPGVLEYPRTEVWGIHTNGTTHAVMPLQPVVVLESVGTNPESSTQQVTAAMIELVKAAAALASEGGTKELMFLSSDAVTDAGAKRCGFEELKCKVFRLKLR